MCFSHTSDIASHLFWSLSSLVQTRVRMHPNTREKGSPGIVVMRGHTALPEAPMTFLGLSCGWQREAAYNNSKWFLTPQSNPILCFDQ